jgi:hypothetical protein
MRNSKTKKNLTAKSQVASSHKAPGTRIGTLLDWREGSLNAVKQRHGQTIRDGR